MKRTTINEEVDAAISALGNPTAFVEAEIPAWLTPFEQGLPFRLPPSYRSFLHRYRFPAFVVGSVKLFGNMDGKDYDDVVVAAARDRRIAAATRANGFIQIGHPSSGNYDPVCLDLRRRSSRDEAGIVRLDHEAILINESIRVVEKVAASFLELLARFRG